MIRYRNEKGNLIYTCWNCKEKFNFKAMRYIEENEHRCPNCNKKIKFK